MLPPVADFGKNQFADPPAMNFLRTLLVILVAGIATPPAYADQDLRLVQQSQVCPADCSGNGVCVGTRCQCHPGWQGPGLRTVPGRRSAGPGVRQRLHGPRGMPGKQMPLLSRLDGRRLPAKGTGRAPLRKRVLRGSRLGFLFQRPVRLRRGPGRRRLRDRPGRGGCPRIRAGRQLPGRLRRQRRVSRKRMPVQGRMDRPQLPVAARARRARRGEVTAPPH